MVCMAEIKKAPYSTNFKMFFTLILSKNLSIKVKKKKKRRLTTLDVFFSPAQLYESLESQRYYLMPKYCSALSELLGHQPAGF